MAQRRILGLLRSIALLLGRRFQTEEERTGPADTRDHSRYLRKRAEPFTVEVKAIVQHGQTMSDSVPFPNQDGSRLQSSSGWLSKRASLRPVPAPALEQAASGRFEAADCLFLQPIPECLDQQVAANPARPIRFEQVAPGLLHRQRFAVERRWTLVEINSRRGP